MLLYKKNRHHLMNRLEDGWIFVLGGTEVLRNSDVEYPFRQSSHFLYLTGIESPGYALALNPKTGREILFIPKPDRKRQVWVEKSPDKKGLLSLSGIRQIETIDLISKHVKTGDKTPIYGDRRSLLFLQKTMKRPFRGILLAFEEALSELRAVKSEGEIALMKRANAVSGAAHVAAMRATRPGLFEYQVQAVLERVFLENGLSHTAYPSIVAAGQNAAVLHYRANTAKLKAHELLLIDAAAECKGYAADITRTFPVSGRFTVKQRDVYEIVLAAQKAAITELGPGVSMTDIHLTASKALIRGLKSLKLILGSEDLCLEKGAHRVFFPHGIGHMLGLDVHDVTGGRSRRLKKRRLPGEAKLRFDRILESGFVITIEPGLYFNPALLHDPENRRRFRGLIDFSRAESFLSVGGVRIEDDILITKTGHQNLTAVPKEITDIEAACQND